MIAIGKLTLMTPRLLPLIVLTGLLAACVSETREVDGPSQDSSGVPYAVLEIPQQMQEVSGDLLRYHALNQSLPPALETLVEQQVMSNERYEALPDYLYAPGGLCKLRDGRVVVLVDAEVRIEGHAWCIVREPTALRSILLNVTPIALSELEAASQ